MVDHPVTMNIGKTQTALILRAHYSVEGLVLPSSHAETCALYRLRRRGLAERINIAALSMWKIKGGIIA